MYVTVNINDYREVFSDWISILFKKLTYIFKNTESSENVSINEDLLEYINGDVIYNHNSIDNVILENLEKIVRFLRTEHILPIEYADFLDIQIIIINTLETGKNADELNIICNLLDNFINITEFKFDLLYEANHKYNNEFKFNTLPNEFKLKFEEKYDKFHYYLLESKLEYYNLNDSENEESISEYFEIMDDDFILNS